MSPPDGVPAGGAIADDPPTDAGQRWSTAEAPTSAPPVRARVLAFAAILFGGATGAFIGYAFTDLQCTGDCATATGIGGLVGGVVAAVGVAVVAVLALRAMGEWRTIQATGEAGNWRDERALRKGTSASAPTAAPATRRRPRVR